MQQVLRLLPAAVLVCNLAIAGCGPERPSAQGETVRGPQKLATSRLPNAIRLHARVISGGQPDGEAAFRELKELGVKTVVSVDGARPDVELARKYGLRYVHLPHGYDGIPQERAQELAKAVRDLEGPIYIHCHHGKHRSPAAATVACVSAGLIEPSAALSVLKTAGTSENYRGLYRSAESARKLDDALLDALQAEFPETAKLPPLAAAMVALEQTHDHLQQISAAGWERPQAHPDLDPPHVALMLREHFTEMLRTDAVKTEPGKFQELMRDSETAAKELEEALMARSAGKLGSPAPQALGKSFNRVTKNCTTCHQQFRDVPLGEKAGEK